VRTATIVTTSDLDPMTMLGERLLLDSGVWIATELPGERFTSAALGLVARSRFGMAALDLTLYEVANVIGAGRGDIPAATTLCRSIALRCRDHLVRVDAELIAASVAIAVEYGLSSYDAAYVAVARHHEWQLVSTDIRDLVSRGLAITPDAAV
jgi:predicted nucleic acid-binding protein